MCPPFNGFFRRRGASVLWTLGAFTVLTGVATGWFALQMEEHGVGIIELELTQTAADAARHYDDLGIDGRRDAMWSLILDFPFLVSYGLLLIGASAAVGNRCLRARRHRLASLAGPVAWGALLAALLDAVENTSLLLILDGNTGSPWPELAYVCALGKFTLVGVALLYSIMGLVLSARPRPAYGPAPAGAD
jgi:hypothetical protein